MRRPPPACVALVVFAGLALAPASRAEERRRAPGEPHAGYVYPAGGCRGATVRVALGGQSLRQAIGVQVSGEGVTGRIDYWVPPRRPLSGEHRKALQRRLRILRARTQAPTTGEGEGARVAPPAVARDGGVELPKHPLLDRLETMSPEELEGVARYFFAPRNPLQRKRAIEETLEIDLQVSADAKPGVRDLRVVTRAGLSNPLRFCVGLLAEAREREPNGPGDRARAIHELPVVVNGQILPNDVDCHRFRARAGQRVVARAMARALIPYQADSVPGWMQATLTLRDAEGHEVAFADEYRFDPDPVLFYEVPRDGEYVLEVRDALARGRADFVYRVAIGELPFITRMFPLGGRCGELTTVELGGWNLRQTRLPLDTRSCTSGLRRAAWRQGDALTNEVTFAVDDLPEVLEAESNDGPEASQAVTLPVIVNGRIGTPDDKDVFRFEARRGAEVVVQVRARALGSPLDSLLRILDAKGAVVAWNDDYVDPDLGVRGLGLQTHQADSYLRTRLPARGTYYVQVSDVRAHGSADHAYRLRISAPRPDVSLYCTPSALNLPAGRAEPVRVYAVRRDGFAGDVDLAVSGGSRAFALGGARIPEGRSHVDITVTAPTQGLSGPVALDLTGVFRIDREEVRRPVLAADNVMQAFLWRHLVPADGFSVHVRGNGRWIPVVTLAQDKPVRLRRGGTARVRFRATRPVPTGSVVFEVVGGPEGVSVQSTENEHDGFVLVLHADREVERDTVVDNLIIEAFSVKPQSSEAPGAKKKKGRKRQQPGRGQAGASLGVLPAVPYVIVR